MSQQALQQGTTQHSTGQKSKARGGRTVVLSVTSFLIGLLDRGYPPWEPENNTKKWPDANQGSKKQRKRKLGLGAGERWRGKRETSFPGWRPLSLLQCLCLKLKSGPSLKEKTDAGLYCLLLHPDPQPHSHLPRSNTRISHTTTATVHTGCGGSTEATFSPTHPPPPLLRCDAT